MPLTIAQGQCREQLLAVRANKQFVSIEETAKVLFGFAIFLFRPAEDVALLHLFTLERGIELYEVE